MIPIRERIEQALARGLTTDETAAALHVTLGRVEAVAHLMDIAASTAKDIDPWAMPTTDERIALAKSILGHTKPADKRTRVAIDRALLALNGATITELQKVID